MIPFLTYPLALIGLAALPALAAIYILRNRFRRRQVSSLMLWQFRVQSKEGGARVNRLQLPLIFFLELLALLLLVTAAAGPHWKLAQSTRPLVVVLDDSFSMRATSENTSAQIKAKEFLRKMYRFQAPPSTRLILAGKEPRSLGASVRNWSEVEKLLAQWECWSPSASLDQAITLASEIGKQQANILVLTDHKPVEEKIANPRLQWRSFGKSVENAAIVNASRTANGDEDRCLLEIANYAKDAYATKLLVETGSNSVQQTLLSLGPGEQQRFVFNLPKTAPMLKAMLGNDGLAEDNQVQLLPPIRKRVRAQVAFTNAAMNDLVNRTLEATGLRSSISENPELIIHQSDFAPSNAWNLRWDIGEKATAFTGPFVVDGSHPLAEGLELDGAIWAATAETNSSDNLPIVLAGNVPLLSVRDDLTGRRFLTLNLNPELSTLQRTPNWPILFWNILQWRASQTPGLQEVNARLGSEVNLKTTGEPVAVRLPGGTVKQFPQTADQLALETPEPGIYTVSMGLNTNLFVVNALAADESDLRDCVTGEWGKWNSDPEQRYEQSPMAWLFGLGALGILTAHLWLLAAGKGGN